MFLQVRRTLFHVRGCGAGGIPSASANSAAGEFPAAAMSRPDGRSGATPVVGATDTDIYGVLRRLRSACAKAHAARRARRAHGGAGSILQRAPRFHLRQVCGGIKWRDKAAKRWSVVSGDRSNQPGKVCRADSCRGIAATPCPEYRKVLPRITAGNLGGVVPCSLRSRS